MIKELGLKKGSRIWTKLENRKITLERAEDSWADLQGSIKDTKKTKGKTILEIIEFAKQEEAKRLKAKYEKQIR